MRGTVLLPTAPLGAIDGYRPRYDGAAKTTTTAATTKTTTTTTTTTVAQKRERVVDDDDEDSEADEERDARLLAFVESGVGLDQWTTKTDATTTTATATKTKTASTATARPLARRLHNNINNDDEDDDDEDDDNVDDVDLDDDDALMRALSDVDLGLLMPHTTAKQRVTPPSSDFAQLWLLCDDLIRVDDVYNNNTGKHDSSDTSIALTRRAAIDDESRVLFAVNTDVGSQRARALQRVVADG